MSPEQRRARLVDRIESVIYGVTSGAWASAPWMIEIGEDERVWSICDQNASSTGSIGGFVLPNDMRIETGCDCWNDDESDTVCEACSVEVTQMAEAILDETLEQDDALATWIETGDYQAVA